MTGLAGLTFARTEDFDEGRHDPLDQGGRVDRRRCAFLDLDGRLGGLWACASAIARRLMPAINCWRTGSLNDRSVS